MNNLDIPPSKVRPSPLKQIPSTVTESGVRSTVDCDQPLNLSVTGQNRSDCHKQPSSPSSEYRPDSNQPSKTLIHQLLDNDHLEGFIHLKSLHPDQNGDPCQRLENIGDEIVEKLVEWTKKLPIYNDLPMDVYSQLLTKQWAEIVLLSTAFYICETSSSDTTTSDKTFEFCFFDETANLRLLCKRLSACMKRTVPLEYVEKEAGTFVKSFTSLVNSLKKLKLSREAYVCLKAITLLHQGTLFYSFTVIHVESITQ